MVGLEKIDIKGQRSNAEVDNAEETAIRERRTLLKALGATLVLGAVSVRCPRATAESKKKKIQVPQKMVEDAKRTGKIDLSNNNVNDISNLGGLNLHTIDLSYTKITNFSPLKSMSSLRTLIIKGYKSANISPFIYHDAEGNCCNEDGEFTGPDYKTDIIVSKGYKFDRRTGKIVKGKPEECIDKCS